jgi:hypothetical protein
MHLIPVSAANHEHFAQIKSGSKKLITRHNKKYSENIFYKDSKVGDLLEIRDKTSGESLIAEIIDAQYFRNISELFDSKLADQSFNKTFQSKKDLADEYDKNRPGYSALLERDGIVVWNIQLISENT